MCVADEEDVTSIDYEVLLVTTPLCLSVLAIYLFACATKSIIKLQQRLILEMLECHVTNRFQLLHDLSSSLNTNNG